ncbi:hypothetical protein GFC01_15440 [Desulfofundulus thermobenzoicus]|uniref:Uncharacterized protein n=1 Tax=Desulfofundulus thermobenzoicus TaxID=29376 RepID=A0A6N7IUQ4_9FIRM|nr:hypothetical protein [Desulfofundulus thermobenzoicus]MQL53631.1 hypothetical protein [Desulfofundulus thermobenzoicus]
MQNALLPNGKIINAKEYDQLIHGEKLFCVSCKKPVIYVGSDQGNREPFFKTTGRGESIHKEDCKERRTLIIFDSLKTINKYTTDMSKMDSEDKYLIKLDFAPDNKEQIPHGSIDEIDESHPKKKFTYAYKYSKKRSTLPKRITSLSQIARLLKNKPEDLSRITFTQQGELFSFTDIVIDQDKATEIALGNKYTNIDFIIYGVVRSVIKTEKVMFVNLDTQDGLKPFDIFVFAGDFKWFTLTKEQLEGKPILARGKIKFNERYNKAEMRVRFNKQIYVFT